MNTFKMTQGTVDCYSQNEDILANFPNLQRKLSVNVNVKVNVLTIKQNIFNETKI